MVILKPMATITMNRTKLKPQQESMGGPSYHPGTAPANRAGHPR